MVVITGKSSTSDILFGILLIPTTKPAIPFSTHIYYNTVLSSKGDVVCIYIASETSIKAVL